MDSIKIRYGGGVTLPLETGDTTAVSADIYIGRPGEVYTLTKNIPLVDGNGVFELDEAETSIPLGKYYYQINVNFPTGGPKKYPSPEDGCYDEGSGFPVFIVAEALDEIEVS